MVLGHFVVSTEASAENLRWLFKTTPAHIVVVTYATGGPSDKTTSIAVAMKQVLPDCWHARWMTCGVVLGKKSRIASVEVKAEFTCGPHQFGCFECLTIDSRFTPRGAVAVAAIFNNRDMGVGADYDKTFKTSVRSAVADHNVRFIAGVFSCPKGQVEALFSSLIRCEGRLILQPWWTEDAGTRFDVEDLAAVAARFGVRRTDVPYMAVYPAYVVMLGPL